MLVALALVGTHSLTAQQLGFLSGYRATSSTFRNYRSLLRTHGMVVVRGMDLVLTEHGLTHVGGEPPGMVATAEEWRALFQERLESGPRALYVALLFAGPGVVVSDEELARASGYRATSSTFRNYRSRLTALGLVERVDGATRLANTPFGP
jgi:hypothetical protein